MEQSYSNPYKNINRNDIDNIINSLDDINEDIDKYKKLNNEIDRILKLDNNEFCDKLFNYYQSIKNELYNINYRITLKLLLTSIGIYYTESQKNMFDIYYYDGYNCIFDVFEKYLYSMLNIYNKLLYDEELDLPLYKYYEYVPHKISKKNYRKKLMKKYNHLYRYDYNYGGKNKLLAFRMAKDIKKLLLDSLFYVEFYDYSTQHKFNEMVHVIFDKNNLNNLILDYHKNPLYIIYLL